MQSVDISYMLDAQTGYIKVNRFSATTYEEFMRGLEDLVDNQGMKDLVIDLRHNPGGYLQQATQILSQLFLEKGKLLVYVEGRTENREDHESTGRPMFDIDNVLVLIDEGSASASEILAGAIQDHDRGIIIGRRSFGKGLVQKQYSLRDGSAIRLTVARYYTPSGRSIQKDYEDAESYDEEVMDRFVSGEMESEENMAVFDSLAFYTSGGRKVYGGGGISPDIFVPIDTIMLNEEYLILRQHVPQFVYRYLEENRNAFDYSLPDFKRSFTISPSMYAAFLDYVEENGNGLDKSPSRQIRAQLSRLIKARIAKHLYDDEGFYSVWNEDDPMLRTVREVLRRPDPLAVIRE